jgi:hypothetical protein
MITKGCVLEFGVKEPLPLFGFPEGRARIRQRNNNYTIVFIRPPNGGIRKFVIGTKNGAWWPVFEMASNLNAPKVVK